MGKWDGGDESRAEAASAMRERCEMDLEAARQERDEWKARCASIAAERDRATLALAEIARYGHATAAGQDLVQYLVGVAREALAASAASSPESESEPTRTEVDAVERGRDVPAEYAPAPKDRS